MTHSRALLLVTAVIALVFGIRPPDPDLTGEPFPVPYDPTLLALLAADQSPNIGPEPSSISPNRDPYASVSGNDWTLNANAARSFCALCYSFHQRNSR
jgi:hypothetical protein